MNIHEELRKWANEYVPKFNDLSKEFKTHYYTQSPLDSINDTINLMIIGINPKGNLNNFIKIIILSSSGIGISNEQKGSYLIFSFLHI